MDPTPQGAWGVRESEAQWSALSAAHSKRSINAHCLAGQGEDVGGDPEQPCVLWAVFPAVVNSRTHQLPPGHSESILDPQNRRYLCVSVTTAHEAMKLRGEGEVSVLVVPGSLDPSC